MARKVLLVLIGIIMIVAPALMSACEPTDEAPDTIRIGAPIPITGAYASIGAEILNGYSIAVDDINEAGGVYVEEYDKNIPLELVYQDDESDPVKTVSKMEALYTTHNIHFYLGSGGSELHAAAVAIAEKYKVPYLGVAFTLWDIHQQGYQYLFSPIPKTPDMIETPFEMLASLPEEDRPTKMAIFSLKTDWGIEQTTFLYEMADEYGYDVVVDMEYTPGTKDFAPIILAAKAAEADSLWSNPIPPDGIAMMKQVKELDWSPKFYYVMRASGPVAWADALGDVGEYVTLSGISHPSLPFPGMAEFAAEHEARYGEPPGLQSANAYACVQILATAIEEAGTLDTETVRDTIAGIDTMTVVGQVQFRADGTPIMPDIVVQWQEGKQEIVWPEEYRTAPFAYPAPAWSER